MRQDERIPNLVSKLKSDNNNIWPHYRPKKLSKTVKNTGKIARFAKFRPFLGKYWVKCRPISILRPDLEFSHPGTSFWPQNSRKTKILFFTPYSISKTSTILRGSLHLTDRAQISYTGFWYRKATFKTLTPKKVSFAQP